MDSHNQVLAFLQKSIKTNRQLDFSQLFTISYVVDGEVNSEMVACLGVQPQDQESHQFQVLTRVDRRSELYNGLIQTKGTVSVCWYFPLSKEKYQIKARPMLVSEQDNMDVQQTLLREYRQQWQNMSQQDRNQYHGAPPDTTKQNMVQQEIDKFNSPDKIGVSSNYVMVVLCPDRVVHTIYHMPQVQADARKKYESIFSPYKKDQKYRHEYIHPIWQTTTLNP